MPIATTVDDLTHIRAIDPTKHKPLNALGVCRFAEIAASSLEDVARVSAALYQRPKLLTRFRPGQPRQRCDATGFAGQFVPCDAGGIDNGVVVVEQAMGEVAFLEIFPDALGGIELGRIGWQRNGRDAVGEFQIVGLVPTGLIDEQRDVLVGPDRRREGVDIKLHADGVHIRQHQREGIVRSRLDGTVDVRECVTLIGCAPMRSTASR